MSVSHGTKPKICRIPTLKRYIPQVVPQTLDIKPPSTTSVITKEHVGSNVRVGEKEGILRYVGEVNFAKGIWCGVELTNSFGKNNGTVNGVQYFTCDENRGLITQAYKVELVQTSPENVSGPYSILCFAQQSLTDKKTNNYTYDAKVQKNQNCTNSDLNNREKRECRPFVLYRKQELASSSITQCSLSSINKASSTEDLKHNSIVNDIILKRTSTLSAENLLALNYRLKNKSYNNPLDQSIFQTKKHSTSAPFKPNSGLCDLIKWRINEIGADNNDTKEFKRDSLDGESLGILTPDQMIDTFISFEAINVNSLGDRQNETFAPNSSKKSQKCLFPNVKKSDSIYRDLQSENSKRDSLDYDKSVTILTSEQMVDFSELTLDENWTLSNNCSALVEHKSIDFRCEDTPSPEELPLDPTPIGQLEPLKNTKNETTKSKTNNSFITSITSITSLDTGYQGDGEMSRPASRGADNSPLTRRPFPRPVTRKPDPLTDSDFYTESDADNHEDNHVKGDRRAQVIDGTLYSVDPQAAADIYANNRENMDSSGVFTDLESGIRHDDESKDEVIVKTVDVSPSDSTKTISENSQNNIREVLQKVPNINDVATHGALDKIVQESSKKRNAPSPSSLSSSRDLKEESVAKKYKTPKRDVASKVKSFLNDSVALQEKKLVKKPVNRWDAVMNKISKTDQNKTNLKDIKSKVFDNLNGSSKEYDGAKKSPLHIGTPNNKNRRIRTRNLHAASPLKKSITSNLQSSIHSSLSDLSASGLPPKKSSSSVKKRENNIQVTQVLTPNKLSTKNQQNLTESKKNAKNIIGSPTTVQNKARLKKGSPLFAGKDAKQQSNILTESTNKSTVKGGRTTPNTVSRSPALKKLTTPPSPPPRTAEALAVLVQHLVFNVEAYQVPHLRRQVEKLELALEECRLNYNTAIEEERNNCQRYVSELVEEHKKQIAHITTEHLEAHKKLTLEKDSLEHRLTEKHDEQLSILRKELERLQKSHEGALDILREEHDCMREQIDEKLRKEYKTNEIKLKEEIKVLKTKNSKLEHQLKKTENSSKEVQEKLTDYIEDNKKLREQNDRLLSYGDDKDVAKQEVQSLRAVLELKQTELAKLRKSLDESRYKQEVLSGAEEMAATLQARCEDLEHQLQQRGESEQSLKQDIQRLQTYIKDQMNYSRTISLQNEELRYKLRQNAQVLNKVIDEKSFNRSVIYSSSFNERHNASKSLERAFSFRESSSNNSQNRVSRNSSVFDEDDLSPPSSPKVKGVVEKSDSVSYVLNLDESPDQVVSRILRRSFRNTTPTKSTSNKRPRFRTNPLSLSASSSAIVPACQEDSRRSRSVSARHADDGDDVFLWNHDDHGTSSTPKLSEKERLDLDEENLDVDLELPALPNEMDKRNGVLTLPSPKRLADSDSNSEDDVDDEDEITSGSSQL
ncbi:restin homolog [Anthonomus grandis grandis]|uniref:restin homolog n=1 Tax=Anthonomus grandis grandis TaxID=2921223 RepID=UPI00216689C6|nr:restin homolog [Anthonomus grandis grandis]